MDLQEIEKKLNILLAGSERKIVFWYDDDGSYEEEIDQLQLSGNSKVFKLTESNHFAAKLLLEYQDLTTNYLVYAPFSRPEDKENSLADIFYYSEHFYSDKLIQLMGELNIPPECQDEVKKYKKFWAGNNLQKFKDLEIETYTNESISLGILCVLAGVKTLSFEEMLRKTIFTGLTDNSIMKKMENQRIDRVFWRFCERQYGYQDSNPTIQKFLVTMLVTYIDAQMNGNEPKPWKAFVSGRKNDAVIFIKNLMNHDESKDFYDGFVRKAGDELNVSGLISQISLENVISSDALPDFDDYIINWIVAKLEDQMLDEKISGLTIPEICDTRMKTGYHYSGKYKERYRMLTAAYYVLKEVPGYSRSRIYI